MTSSDATFEGTLEEVSAVPGWMTPGQARCLWDRASVLGEGARIVEIGSYQGRSTVLLGTAVADGVELIAIDPHGSSIRTYEVREGQEDEAERLSKAFLANLEAGGVADKVTYIRKSSHAALWDVDGSVDLLYIDGSHNYGPARNDMLEWGSRVVPGGTMLIHDSFTSAGVTLAILSALLTGREFDYVGRTGSLTEYRRARLSLGGRVRNAARMLGELPYFVRNVAVEVLLLMRLRPLTKYLGYDTSLDWPH